jgi:hypothetical protein
MRGDSELYVLIEAHSRFIVDAGIEKYLIAVFIVRPCYREPQEFSAYSDPDTLAKSPDHRRTYVSHASDSP